MQIQPRLAGATPSQKVADHYRADLLALGATEVVAKPAGVLVVATDPARASLLDAVLSTSPHGVHMQVAAGTSAPSPVTPTTAAVADALAGANLAGVTAVSSSDGGVLMGTRMQPFVRVHVSDERRAAELNELLRVQVGATMVNGTPQLTSGFTVRATTGAPVASDLVVVRS